MFVRNAGFHSDPQSRLFIDQWIDIDWKHKVFADSWSGELSGSGPTYEVGFIDPYSPKISEHGIIQGGEDIAWLRSAIDHRRWDEGPMKLVARIHQLKLRRDGYEGFEVEVLTGDDADALIKAAKRDRAIETFKEVWWLIPIGLGILWWLL